MIIDIGANIGDTAIAMMQNCNNNIVCIEPSNIFFNYLEKNLNLLPAKDKGRIKIIKSMIGTGSFSGTLKESTSTAHAVIATTSKSTHIPLDQIIENKNNVILIKVDTDGFDYDVLLSAKNTLKHSEPLLFWENEISEDFQLTGFEKMYLMLIELGYKYVYLFDNFGNFIALENDFSLLRKLNTYIYSQKNMLQKSIYYTDVLASTEKHNSIALKAIEQYKLYSENLFSITKQ